MPDGLLDTNVVIHAHANDSLTAECRAFLSAIESGALRVRLEPLVLHELTYALPHYIKQMTRDEVAEYLLMVLSWDGVQGDRSVMIDAVQRWQAERSLAFVAAYLAAVATALHCPVYTKNVRELRSQGVAVPDPLPASDSGEPSDPPSVPSRSLAMQTGRLRLAIACFDGSS